MDIKVRYSSIDGFSQSRRFKTLDGARKYAQKWVGAQYEVGGWYAVSSDGIGKVVVSGDATLAEVLAPAPVAAPAPAPEDDGDWEGPNSYT